MERETQRLYEFGPFQLDVADRLLRRDNVPIPLTPKAYEILLALVENSGHLLKKEELMQRVWPESFVEEANLAQQIFTLRKALGEENGTRYIETVPKHGYRFVAPVKLAGAANAAGPEAATTLPPQQKSPRRARLGWLVLAAGLALVLYSGWRFSRQAAAPASGKMVLVVLPFNNLSGDPDQDYLSEGLTDEVISQLSRIAPARLAVIARTTAARYKERKLSAAEIGEQLRADFLLESSVRREGGRLRLTSQLIETRTQTHVWSADYDRAIRDILPLQAELARTVAGEIEVALLPPRLPSHEGSRDVDPQAYEAYLKGRYFWNKRTEAGYAKAIQYFQQAVERAADYAPAYAGLADTYALLGSMTNSTLHRSEAMPRARAFAEKALALDESLAEAHTSLAFVQMHFEHDWAAAEKEFQRAIALNPSYVTAHHWYAYCLIAQSRVDEALHHIHLAQQLDPLSLIINTDVAELLYLARRYDEAIAQAQKALELDPSFSLAHRVVGLGYEQKGMYEQAVAALQQQAALSGRQDHALAELGRAYALLGNRKEAEKIERQLLALKPENPGTPIGLALLYAALGNKNQAFFWLEKSIQERMGNILFSVEPRYDSLRTDPRFHVLCQRIGLPAVEKASS